ncbi:MAG: hypothetical protein D4S00_00950 [Streptomycetaceae bacterium]|nr:MAG: hypothetical protein D4S00_00950 [Streptomycetaceae bacterium]
MSKRIVIFLLVLATALSIAPANAFLGPASIPAAFNQLLKVHALSNPAMILIDESTGEIVYERNASSQRKPASVMKIISGAAILEYLDPQSSFETKAYLGTDSKVLIIQGSLDPWMSTNNVVAKKMHRTSLPVLASKSMSALKSANHGSLRNIKVEYSQLYTQDLVGLKVYWAKRGFKPTIKAVSSEALTAAEGEPVFSSKSPTIAEILDFTLLWSDNLLAERLARLASKAAGHGATDKGIALTFNELLHSFNIDTSKLIIADGSGLSKKNRVTAQIIGQLLVKVRSDEKLSLLYASLPVSGVSGTLKDRFLTTAPNAVGLVHAKTGTLSGDVTLAGFVESRDREYVFVTLADEIAHGTVAEDKARAAIDRMLGRIAAPNINAQISSGSATP